MEKQSADFSSYTLEDLIDDPRFILWVTTPDNDLDAFWKKVQNEYPQITPVIAAASKIVLSMRFSTATMNAREQQVLWTAITEEAKLADVPTAAAFNQSRSSAQAKPSFTVPLWLRAAAAVFVFGILSLSIFLYLQQQQTVITTAFGQTKTVALPDGSMVTLNANSALHYATNWDKKAIREVWITGEAFFKVNHLHQSGAILAADRFVVHAEELNVEVLGTTFNVKNRRGKVNVALVTGRVGVAVEGASNPLIKLIPGELAEYTEKGQAIYKKAIYTKDYTSWHNGELHFNKTPLSEIFALIEDNYGYTVITKDNKIGKRQLSGNFSLSSEDAFFKAISTTLGISFQKNQATHQLIIK